MITRNNIQECSEEELVARAAKGDLEAFNQLIESYQDLAYHHAWTFLFDQNDAEDVTQDSFIKAYLSIGRFRGGSFRAWLLKIVSNTSIDYLRKRSRDRTQPLNPEFEDGTVIETPVWLVDPSLSVERIVEQTEQAGEIYRTLSELPEIYRMPLLLIDVYDFDYKETGKALNIKVGTVKSRILRARLKMRAKLRNNSNVEIPSKNGRKPRRLADHSNSLVPDSKSSLSLMPSNSIS